MSLFPRRVEPEELDGLAADDPRGRRSRRDLRRVHVAMRSVSNLQRAVAVLRLAVQPRRILELGAGDGTLLLRFARAQRPRWNDVKLTLLDRVDLVSEQTHAGYRELGWQGSFLRADALEWAASRQPRGYALCFAKFFPHLLEAAPRCARMGCIPAGPRLRPMLCKLVPASFRSGAPHPFTASRRCGDRCVRG